MSDSPNLQQYYADRAREYERVYDIPERQADLRELKTILPHLLSGHDILELACGTGYWTQPISLTAHSILATDVNSEVLELAQAKSYPHNNVHFQLADALTLEGISGEFTAGFAGFWWSHITLSELPRFLSRFHAKLGPGKLVVFLDNTRTGTRHPFTRQDAEGNTYQTRHLEDGRQYEVLKNLPTEAEINNYLAGIATEVQYASLPHYWYIAYRTA